MNKNLTEIAFILDRSGSMAPVTEAAITGFNVFLRDQQKTEGQARLTLVLFDNEYLVPLDCIPVQEAVSLDTIVGYGPEPGECVRIARKKFLGCVVGNHEAMLRYSPSNKDCDEQWESVGQALKIAMKQLGDSEDMAWLRRLPVVIEEDGMMLVHSSPYRPGSFTYIHNYEDAKASFQCQGAELVFYGHTHVPAVWKMRGKRIQCSSPGEDLIRLKPGTRYMINVGSVGQPRDDDPRACYVIYDPEKKVIRFRRIPYDIKTAQDRFYAACLPSRNSLRLAQGQ